MTFSGSLRGRQIWGPRSSALVSLYRLTLPVGQVGGGAPRTLSALYPTRAARMCPDPTNQLERNHFTAFPRATASMGSLAMTVREV